MNELMPVREIPKELLDEISYKLSEIEMKNKKPAFILMNPSHYADIRFAARDMLDLNTHRETLRRGMMATLWGVQVVVNSKFEHIKCLDENDKRAKAFFDNSINPIDFFIEHEELEKVTERQTQYKLLKDKKLKLKFLSREKI